MDSQPTNPPQIAEKPTNSKSKHNIWLMGLPGSGKTVLLLGLFQHAISLSADSRLRYEAANEAAEKQSVLLLQGRFPEQKKDVEEFEFEYDGKPIVVRCEPGETVVRKGGNELSSFFNQNFCFWVQNPFVLDRKFSTLCFLGLIARFQSNKLYADDGAVNLIDLVTEAMFSWVRVEKGLEKAAVDTMELRNPVTWRAVYDAFKYKDGGYAITIELTGPVVDPFEAIDGNFKIRAIQAQGMPRETNILSLIEEYLDVVIGPLKANLRKSGDALREAPTTPVVMSHMDIILRAGMIFAESALRQLCTSWLGVESLHARRAIYAEPLIKTRIQPGQPDSGARHVRPIQFVTSASKHIFEEAMLTWRQERAKRSWKLFTTPMLWAAGGAAAGVLAFAVALYISNFIPKGAPDVSSASPAPAAKAAPAATPTPAAKPAGK